MRKLIIIAASLVALAIPTAAMASVAVDTNGYGVVGKGDVQTALGLGNDAAMQDLFKKGEIKFTTSYTTATDNTRACMKFGGPGEPVFVPIPGATVHVIFTTQVTQEPKVTANTNGAGKLSNGWTLNGFDGPVTYGPETSETIGTCPAGSIGATKTIEQKYTESARSGLMVNGKPLPNTPVV
jgi:hypothetical protein